MIKRVCLLAASAALMLATCVTTAHAATPWPTNGTVNPATKTVTLEYNKALYETPVVTGFPTNGYAESWVGSTYRKLTTPEAANALLMTRLTRNTAVRIRIPHKDIDTTGKLNVRHGLTLNYPHKTTRTFVVRGKVAPTSGHSVRVSIQKKYLGVWVTRQKQTVKTGAGGAFVASFSAKRYAGTYRVKANVASDTANVSKTAYRLR